MPLPTSSQLITPVTNNTNAHSAEPEEIEAVTCSPAISDNNALGTVQVADNDPKRPLKITEGVRNPLFDERPWFFSLTPEMPVLVGEASDAAFATRIRQELLGENQVHYPRTQNMPDESLCSLWHSETVWPTPSRARFLLKVVFDTVCRRYYLTRKSITLRLLEQAISDPAQCDILTSCKLYAFFALGEAYSTRTCHQPGNEFPGIAYYASATQMLRVFSEQPRIDCVEIMIALVRYILESTRTGLMPPSLSTPL